MGSDGRRPAEGSQDIDSGATIPLKTNVDTDAPTLERDPALAQTAAVPSGGSQPRAVDPSPVTFDSGKRYDKRRLLGAGGMGDVNLCADAWIGREVAMKVLRQAEDASDTARVRFLREARVQGQLEHPSVVPVYDLGVAASGSTFFTMKRVKGRTLEEILVGLRDGDAEVTHEYSRRKLLAAISRVCLTVAFAHQRGVIHRDLKPANIMFGDFGEVYVLDWGVAKISGVADLDLTDVLSGDETEAAQTAAGSLIGTPGYMAPEQARGDNDAISPQSDVYALGAMLFEVLTLQPLHRGPTITALLASTMKGVEASPRACAPDLDVAPELDDICVRATALSAEDRYAGAKEMADAIDDYLDGQRDAEHRAQLAARHLESARRALSTKDEGPEGDAARTRAMREVTRALALQPDNTDALRLLMEWVSDSSTELSSEAEEALKEVEQKDRVRAARRGALAYMSWYLLTPFIIWME